MKLSSENLILEMQPAILEQKKLDYKKHHKLNFLPSLV